MVVHDLRKIRQCLGFDQGEMARFLGLSKPSYIGWELGRSVPRVDHEKMIKFLYLCQISGISICVGDRLGVSKE